MSGNPISKGTMPKSLDLNGEWKKVYKKALDDLRSIKQKEISAGVSSKIATARSCILRDVHTAIVKKLPVCLIWDIPDDELVFSPGFFVDGEKILELRGDSLLFQSLCSREKISGEETLPIEVRICFPNRGIYVNIEKFKKIMGIKE